MSKALNHGQIPGVVYDCLRAVHESRAKRLDNDAVIRHIGNAEIFFYMPDHKDINWRKGEQAHLIDMTLDAMARTVKWSE